MNRYRNAVIIVALLVVAGLLALMFIPRGGEVENGPPPPPGPVGEGGGIDTPQTDPPPPVGNPARIREVYGEGNTYRRTVVYAIEAVGQHREWGLGADYSALYAGRMVTDSKIERNDGTNIVAKVTVTAAKTESARRRYEGVRVDLGPRAHALLSMFGPLVEIPPGTSVIVERVVNAFLNTPEAREIMRAWPIQTFLVEALEGYVFRVHFVDGRGVVNIQLVQAPDNRDFGGRAPFIDEVALREFANHFNPIFDVALFPDEDVEIGRTWQVAGRSLPNLFPTEMSARITDAVTFQREADRDGLIALTVPKHSGLNFIARPKGREIRAQLSLSGDLLYDRGSRVFQSAEFSGELPMEYMSTDYIIFPQEHKLAPKFHLKYTCEVMD